MRRNIKPANKFTLCVFVMAFLNMTVWAQTAVSYPHTPRCGDELSIQQITFKDAGMKGQGVCWNFSDIEVLDNRCAVCYFGVEGKEDTVAEMGRNKTVYYGMGGDTLMIVGYESNIMKVDYDCGEAVLRQPIRYGDNLNGLFHGFGCYSERMMMRVSGSYEVNVDGEGCLILPSGDTLRGVKRVHMKKMIVCQIFKEINTETKLKTFIDSVCPYNADSIAWHLKNDRMLMEKNTYRWYAQGYRYPIIETMEFGRKGYTPLYVEAFYCPVQEQERLDDNENEQMRDYVENISEVGDEKSNNGQPYYEISVNDGIISVCCISEQDVDVKMLVCDVSGIVYSSSVMSCKAGERTVTLIDCKSFRHGEYVLYLNVAGSISGRKVNI